MVFVGTFRAMSETPEAYDAIIIGAGVIGAAIAHELAGRGWKTHRRQGGLCRCRFNHQLVCDCALQLLKRGGTNLAWEGMHYWKDWPAYIGTDDELGLIDYHMTGQLVFQPPGEGTHAARVKALWDEMDIPHETWDAATIKERLPYLDPGLFGPPTRPDDDAFWKGAQGAIERGYFAPDAGYVSDPQLSCHNLNAEPRRTVPSSGSAPRSSPSIARWSCRRGHARRRPVPATKVVVNVAGPHSYIINEMAGVYESMNIKTRALRHEVHRASASGRRLRSRRGHSRRRRSRHLFRPEVGNHILIGSGDPVCDEREYVDPDDYDQTINAEQWEVQMLRANRRLPALGMPHDKKGIVDLYDVSDDWIPIYDRTDLDGFYVAIGTSGNQYKTLVRRRR